MEHNSKFYESILNNLYEGVYFTDRDRKITYWNKGAEKLTGYSRTEVIGKHCSDNILMHVSIDGIPMCEGICPVAKTISDGKTREEEAYFQHRDGYRVRILMRVNPVFDAGGKVTGAVEIFSDRFSELEMAQRIEDLQKMAMLDFLTGIGNRRAAAIKLNARLDKFRRYKWPFGILLIDIDEFKKINDSFGHEAGDKVLKMVSKTLLNSLRSFDFIGRWGGEEFISIVENVDSNQLYSIACKLCLLVERSSITIGSKNVRVTVSIGATVARKKDSIRRLIKRADELLYKSKAEGRNRVTI